MRRVVYRSFELAPCDPSAADCLVHSLDLQVFAEGPIVDDVDQRSQRSRDADSFLTVSISSSPSRAR